MPCNYVRKTCSRCGKYNGTKYKLCSKCRQSMTGYGKTGRSKILRKKKGETLSDLVKRQKKELR